MMGMAGDATDVVVLVVTVLISHLVQRGVAQCPERCLCFRSNVRCMFLNLETVPPGLPSDTTVL
jgi:peroxidase